MNGFVVAGYVVSIGTLVSYGASLATRERTARRRATRVAPSGPGVLDALLSSTDPEVEWSDPEGGRE